jgi:hypothetical protein
VWQPSVQRPCARLRRGRRQRVRGSGKSEWMMLG